MKICPSYHWILYFFIIPALLLPSVAWAAPSRTDLRDQFLKTARSLESGQQLVKAEHYYRLAQAVDPDNREVRDAIDRVGAERQRRADERYRAGLKHYQMGVYNEATRAFLAALRLWPDHQGALQELKKRRQVETSTYILHTVGDGENLAIIAKYYYGDASKFPLIAHYNDLADATLVRLGQQLKIPVVEGFAPSEDKMHEIVEANVDTANQQAVEEQVSNYRDIAIELFEDQQYEDAIIEFKKVLYVTPDDQMAQQHLISAYALQASRLSEQNRHKRAIAKLDQCMAFVKACVGCAAARNQCEPPFKEYHYDQGIRYFEKEQLAEAIEEWNRVKEVDPDYKQVRHYIEQAKKIDKKLKEIKRSKNS